MLSSHRRMQAPSHASHATDERKKNQQRQPEADVSESDAPRVSRNSWSTWNILRALPHPTVALAPSGPEQYSEQSATDGQATAGGRRTQNRGSPKPTSWSAVRAIRSPHLSTCSVPPPDLGGGKPPSPPNAACSALPKPEAHRRQSPRIHSAATVWRQRHTPNHACLDREDRRAFMPVPNTPHSRLAEPRRRSRIASLSHCERGRQHGHLALATAVRIDCRCHVGETGQTCTNTQAPSQGHRTSQQPPASALPDAAARARHRTNEMPQVEPQPFTPVSIDQQ
jgi:hypothetical protein